MTSLLPELLDLPEGFRILTLLPSEQQIIVAIASTAAMASCPQCTSMSTRLHSNYTRRLADVPCGGRTIVLHVSTHKWRCQNQDCPQKIFAERLTPLAHVQARMTQRCVVALQHLGLFVNGEGGVRLGHHLGIVTSPTTLLRRVMDMPDPVFLPPRRSALMTGVRHEVAWIAVRPLKGGIVPGVLPPVPCQAESSAPGTM